MAAQTFDWTRVYSAGAGEDYDVTEDAAAAGAKEWASWLTGCSHDHADERRVHEMPMEDLLACCAVYKRTGNMYYAEGCFDRALDRYQRALIYYEYAFTDDMHKQVALHRVRLACLLNTASCLHRLGRYDEAATHLTQAISMSDEVLMDSARSSAVSSAESGHSESLARAYFLSCLCRAHIRRAQSYYCFGHYENSRSDCVAVLSLVGRGEESMYLEPILARNIQRQAAMLLRRLQARADTDRHEIARAARRMFQTTAPSIDATTPTPCDESSCPNFDDVLFAHDVESDHFDS